MNETITIGCKVMDFLNNVSEKCTSEQCHDLAKKVLNIAMMGIVFAGVYKVTGTICDYKCRQHEITLRYKTA